MLKKQTKVRIILEKIANIRMPNATVTINGKKVKYDRNLLYKTFPKALSNAKREMKEKGMNQLEMKSVMKHMSKESGMKLNDVKKAVENDRGLIHYLALKHGAKMKPARDADKMVTMKLSTGKQVRKAYWWTEYG
jgi:3-hydroxyisobutyrate dehydrogenase-like beta-hydroxyacid dehydrogenase